MEWSFSIGKRQLVPFVAFLFGLTVGMLMENKIYWNHQQGYYNEILLRLSYLEAEMKNQRVLSKRRRTSTNKKSFPSISGYNSATGGGVSSSEEFFDAESDLECCELFSGNNATAKVLFDLNEVGEESEFDMNELVQLIRQFDYEAAYVYAFQSLKQCPRLSTCCDFMWRWAMLCFSLSRIEEFKGNIAASKEYLFKADAAASQALELNTNSSPAHKWRAIILGQIIRTASVRERVAGGFKFRELVERAMELDPTDPELHELIGRWKFEIAKVSWIERKTANYLFGANAVPEMTVRDALESLEEAGRLREVRLDLGNLLWRAKCHLELNDIESAVELLNNANELSVHDVLLKEDQTEMVRLLESYS